MSARHCLSAVVALVAVFISGIAIAYTAHAVHPLPGELAIVFSIGLVFALSADSYRRSRDRSASSTRRRILVIHEQVNRLTQAGYDMLAPHDGDTQTARVLIRMERSTAVIEKEGWQGVYRRYSLQENGCVRRSITGDKLTDADHEWLHGELTPNRLEYLLQSLQTYTPRQRTPIATF
jgi:hypothetical protein